MLQMLSWLRSGMDWLWSFNMSPRPDIIDVTFGNHFGPGRDQSRGLRITFATEAQGSTNVTLMQNDDAIVIPWEYIDSVIKILKVYGYDKA